MALNLITLTRVTGEKVEVNPQAIMMVETVKEVTTVTLGVGEDIQVSEPQTRVREMVNRRAPDGFG